MWWRLQCNFSRRKRPRTTRRIKYSVREMSCVSSLYLSLSFITEARLVRWLATSSEIKRLHVEDVDYTLSHVSKFRH